MNQFKDENGNIVLKKGKPDSQMQNYVIQRTFHLIEGIDVYFEREVIPYNPDAWIDKKKTKVGYEIPFTRLFYKYEAPEKSEDIAERIKVIEERIVKSFELYQVQDVKVTLTREMKD